MALQARWITVAAFVSFLLFPVAARAQPWALPDGEGSVSVLYHHIFVQDHLFSRGDRRDSGHIRTQVVTLDIEYGLTDRLSVRTALPYVATKYTRGADDVFKPHKHPGEVQPAGFQILDDETYHSAFQDFRAEARYGAMEFPIAIAPFVAVNLPTHNYEVFAHSAIGGHMTELQLGTYVGALVGPIAVQGRLSYGVHERVIGHRRNRSTIDTEIGWLAGRNFRLSVFQLTQFSHGGFDLLLEDALSGRLSTEEWYPHHDQLARANLMNVGGSVSVRLMGSMAMYGSVFTTLTGANTHAAKYGVTVGTSWGFGGSQALHAVSGRR